MNSRVMHSVYLPFDEKTLRDHHFVEVAGHPKPGHPKPDHLAYYRDSIERWCVYQERRNKQLKLEPGEATRGLQIEKDERFWVVAALMALYCSEDAPAAFASLLHRSGLDAPPGGHSTRTWKDVLTGDLQLWFEVALGSPRDYHDYLRPRLDERSPIPHVRDAAGRPRVRLEGATHVDALLLNRDNNVAVLFEAKVLADCSATVTYDVLRNQLARNIDVMLDRQPKLTDGLASRDPDLSCFVLLTPELYRDHPRSRLYGWLLKEYRKRPLAIREDLPHREEEEPYWCAVSQRIGWATFEDCRRVEASACRWLPEALPEPNPLPWLSEPPPD